MKIKSPLVSQVSGSVGGLTGSHNQGGMYFRARAIPVNPGTAAQTAIRNSVNTLSTAWGQVLTASQRAAWETYNENVLVTDRLGEPRQIGALAHYIRSNVPRLQAGMTRIDDAPTIFDLGSFTNPTITASNGDPYALSVAFDDGDAWVDEDDAAMLIYASRQQSPAINFFKGPYQFADGIDGNTSAPPTPPAAINAQFAGAAGNAAFSFVRVTRADGRLSPLSRFRFVIS